MEKKLNLFGILLFATLLLASVQFVSSTATLVTPASSAVASGSAVVWNATNSSGFANMLNCSIYVSSPSTANSTAVNVSTSTNSSAASLFIDGTFNSNLIEDSNDYSVYASCANITHIENSTANTAIVIENTIPQAASSMTPADGSTDEDSSSVAFSGTVTNANTTSCTLFFTGINPGSTSYTMTYSASSCSYTLSNPSDQTYQWYIRASDGTNTTNSVTQTIHVQDDDFRGNPAGVNEAVQQQANKKNTTTWIIIGVVVVVGFMIFKRKK